MASRIVGTPFTRQSFPINSKTRSASRNRKHRRACFRRAVRRDSQNSRCVHTVGNYVNVAAVKILLEQIGGALRDRRERVLSIGIEATLEGRQQPIVGSPMQVSQNRGLPASSPALFSTREFRRAAGTRHER